MIKDASAVARWTLTGAVFACVVLLAATVYLLARPTAGPPPPLEAAAPWEPPPPVQATISLEPAPSRTQPEPVPSVEPEPAPTRRPATKPPVRTKPPTRPPVTKPPAGPNLSLRGDGGADGSTKAQGRSFKDVRDGRPDTFWSPVGNSGEISVKWPVPVTVGRIVIRENGERRIGGWQVRNHDNDAVLASGRGAGEISFRPVALRKVTFVIFGSDGTPRVAEYETFAR